MKSLNALIFLLNVEENVITKLKCNSYKIFKLLNKINTNTK